jgi:hypothetical protein
VLIISTCQGLEGQAASEVLTPRAVGKLKQNKVVDSKIMTPAMDDAPSLNGDDKTREP